MQNAATLERRIDPDFARDVLQDLYTYRRKRTGVARLLWLTLGWFGGHRFYLGRTWTALLMMFTLGGAFLWWIVDAFLIARMVAEHNDEQERRRDAGLPPLELAFMPALSDDVLREPPAWTHEWRARSPARRSTRMVGDVLVLVVAGMALGALADTDGAEEAIFAILAMVAVTAAGGATGRVEHVPGIRSLIRWSHRVRLFYYFNEPRGPIGLLLRPVIGILLAPFRRRDRAETRLYLQLGFAFTLLFLLVDLVPKLIVPVLRDGSISRAASGMFEMWVSEAAVTFVVTYMFAAPIGAVLTLSMLTRRTHFLPRVLSLITLGAIVMGLTSTC